MHVPVHRSVPHPALIMHYASIGARATVAMCLPGSLAALQGKFIQIRIIVSTLPICCDDIGGWREPTGRHEHSTVVVDNQLYLWGGDQDGMPRVHDSAEKRQFFSGVEVFDVNTGCWEQHTTSGTPPLGVAGYSCFAVRNELHYFGGWCGHSACYHNSVHTLSTSTLQWRMLAPSTTDSGAPMQKQWCGMVHFTDGEEDLLYVVGGYGRVIPSPPQHRAQYQKLIYDVRTNEQHIFSLTKS